MMSAKDFMPKTMTIAALKKAAKGCHGCPLYKKVTQTVFGEGSDKARLIIGTFANHFDISSLCFVTYTG